MSRRVKKQRTIWDYMSQCERPAPTKEDFDVTENEVMVSLSRLGPNGAIATAAECLCAFLYADGHVVGSPSFEHMLNELVLFLVRRTRRYEAAEELLPLDIRNAVLQ
jgi:hypothetical protein